MLILAAALQASAILVTARADTSCGYASCHKQKKGVLNVHIVPHSHDDVGWLKTMKEYYYGRRNYVQHANVSAILGSVFEALQENSDRRFVQVETAYLWMWWQRQDEDTRRTYRRMVHSGQLHMAGGGWTMNDEATTNYQSIINNFSWGLRRLNDSFGPCGLPRVGWQIDSFGHSREMAAIMALMGFDGTVINRIDYQDKYSRQKTHNMEFLWRASSNLDGCTELFTTALFDHYSPPPLCCWDVLCSDPDIADWNEEFVISTFVNYVKEQARYFSTNNVLVTMGNDFTFMDAKRYYDNIDKLIKLVNTHQADDGDERMNVMYSTPDCYLKAVHDSRPELRVHSNDFFPYASSKDVYWTGFYTSRPTLKYYERLGNNFLQVCKQLCALSGAPCEPQLDTLREAMGVLQHHDAISGTVRRRVARDYANILSGAIHDSSMAARKSLNKLLAGRGVVLDVEMMSCLLLNISHCEVSERSEDFVVTVYNPLSRHVSRYVRLPVLDGGVYKVTDMAGGEQPTQTVPVPPAVRRLKSRRSATASELVFRALDVPPLGLRSYRILRLSGQAAPADTGATHATVIGSERLKVELNATSGLVSKIAWDGVEMALRQDIMYYSGFGGAYVFKPDRGPTPIADTVAYRVYTGNLVDEIHQEFDEWASQIVRVYKEEEHVEFEWLVGPIPRGTDVISKFRTKLRNEGVFYTDSNGRELLRRTRGHRANRRVKVTQPVAGNYFPVTERIVVRDEASRLELAVLTDRAQGGSSVRDGELELMLHRRMVRDDGMGVGEVLDDHQPARGHHYVLAGKLGSGRPSLTARERLLAQSKLLQPWLFFTPTSSWPPHYAHQYSGLKVPLPDNVQILTLEPWGEGTILLRLEHVVEGGKDDILSRNATVHVKELLAPVMVLSMLETTLDGNQWLSDVVRLGWQTTGSRAADSCRVSCGADNLPSFTVCLVPMQIRTFVLHIKYLDI